MSVNMRVEFCGITLPSPVIAASGTFGFGTEYADYVCLDRIGGIALKGLTREPRAGNAGVRIAETAGGILNCIGLENPGVDAFVEDILPALRTQTGTPLIANISGNTVEDYAYMAQRLQVEGIAALEVNISCPNVRNGCLAFGVDAAIAAEVTRQVKAHAAQPVIVKLSPNVTDITVVAQAVEAAGADAISLINTLLGMAIDAERRIPLLGNVTGGLSGPCVKPIALRLVWQVAQAVKIPICGMGGIMTGTDAIEFMMAGADCVSVGTATIIDPRAVERIGDEMEEWCRSHGVEDVRDLVGTLQVPQAMPTQCSTEG